MSLSQTAGTHSLLCHYGYYHLLVNLYQYCDTGIKENEIIYFSTTPKNYIKLYLHLTGEGINPDYFRYKPVKELFLKNNQIREKRKVEEKLQKEINEIQNNGYNGVRWINQLSYARDMLSRTAVLTGERYLNDLILRSRYISFLCFIDFRKENSTYHHPENIFTQILSLHKYKMYKNKIVSDH